MLDRINECVRSIREKTSFVPEIGIVLGSGLGAFGEQIDVENYLIKILRREQSRLELVSIKRK